MSRASISDWRKSDDATRIDQSRSTGRYLIRAWALNSRRVSWYVADTIDGAIAVGAQGYTPGSAPGAYRYLSRDVRLKEVLAVRPVAVAQ